MSRWCGTCNNPSFPSCDNNCPAFGESFESMVDKYFKIINKFSPKANNLNHEFDAHKTAVGMRIDAGL